MTDNATPSGAVWWLGPDSRIGGYIIEETISSGEAAAVFRARDERLGRLAAVKVLSPSLAGDVGFRARFLGAYRPVAALDEPHIVPVYGVGEDAGILYIATRFIPGGDIERLLKQAGRPLSPLRVASLITQVAAALDAVHAARLVHGGVKPSNILIDDIEGRPERAYLADLGLSRAVLSRNRDPGLSRGGAFRDRRDFGAAERTQGKLQATARTDQVDLGRVAAGLLTTAVLDKSEDHPAAWSAYLQEPSLSALPPGSGFPGPVGDVLRKGMDPEACYRSCRDFAAALRNAIEPAAPPTGDRQASADARMPAVSGPVAKPDVAPSRRSPGRRFSSPLFRRAAQRGITVSDSDFVQVGDGNRMTNRVEADQIRLDGGENKIYGSPTITTSQPGTPVPQGTIAGSGQVARGRAVVAASILAAFAFGAGHHLALSGSAPGSVSAPWPAALTGEWTVRYPLVKQHHVSLVPPLTSDAWTFTPKCAASLCPVTVTGALEGSEFTVTLRLSGHMYSGSSRDVKFLYCGSALPGILTLKITEQRGKETDRHWIPSAWSGSMTFSTPAKYGCPASNFTATVRSSAISDRLPGPSPR
jgi:Protein kinase domain